MLRCPVKSLSRLSSSGTCCASYGPLRGESPERRSCFSTFEIISFVSSPLSVITTITAFLWSIHKPTAFFMSSSFVASRQFKLKRLRSDGENRVGCYAHHLFGDAAQEHMPQGASTVGAHNDHIRF